MDDQPRNIGVEVNDSIESTRSIMIGKDGPRKRQQVQNI